MIVLAVVALLGSQAVATAASAVPSTITFPLDAPKSVIESQSPLRWCFASQGNCHHDYNAADIFAPTGTRVVSPVSGTVISATLASSGVGSRVQIRDDEGDIWYLAHMHHSPGLAVTDGQRVARGTLIGYVGTSAHAVGTQPHLHIDMLPPPYTSRPSCSGSACAAYPFVNLQPLLVAAYNNVVVEPPPPPPPAQLVGAVSAVTRGDRYDVFGRTADNRLLQWTYLNSQDGRWHGPTDLGGPVISAAAVTVDSSGRYDVFAIGSNHQLIHRIYQGGSWSAWEHLGGVLHYGISVVNPSPGRFDVFGVDTDYHLVQKIYAGGQWSAWNDLGGVLRSAPDVVSVGGRYDVFATDTDHHMVQKVYYGDGNWSNWNDLGGYLTSAPSVTRRGDRYDVFATDSDHHLVHKIYDGTAWTGWNDLGGVLTAAPTAVNPDPGRYDIFAANTNHHLIQKIYNGTWNPWNTITTTKLAG
ncbi:peptidoglycan DD-metalloendopeptidase family protein [Phytohabitans sp. LJ34]|uniref:peptidoglycan DD-metalloendopeptidase family protein n=1 Tax=Phytohabitans sp. LJ34 TaxID=3452217 RepID=UPI003F8B2BB1